MRDVIFAIALIGGTAASMACVYMFGAHNGYVAGHTKVANECERLGSFYVGDRDFSCEVLE